MIHRYYRYYIYVSVVISLYAAILFLMITIRVNVQQPAHFNNALVAGVDYSSTNIVFTLTFLNFD